MKKHDALVSTFALLLALGLTGCAGRTALIPVSDPDLKKTTAEFAADAAKRTYKADLPRGGDAQAQAEVNHGVFNRIQALNLSEENWSGVEIWVNGHYVVYLANWPSKQLKKINFQMLFNGEGQSFPINNKAIHVEKVEMVKDGKLFTIPMKLAD